MNKLTLFIIGSALLIGAPARADSDCWNSDHTIYDCGSHSSGAVGASAPLLGDTLESNPAALPVEPAPFGIESLYSDRSFPEGRHKLSVSTIKGFEGIGFGVGAWSDGTFSAPDFPQHYLGSSVWDEYQYYESHPPSVLGLRLGTTLLLPKGGLPKGIRISVGGSVGLGRVHGEGAPQVGLLARLFGIGLGYSENFERLSTKLPKARISNFAAGIELGVLYLGYTYSTIRSSVNKTYSNTVSMRIRAGKWTVHGALKSQKDHRGAPDSWWRSGIQRRLGSRLGLGYEYGYYRHSHSGVLQIYF